MSSPYSATPRAAVVNRPGKEFADTSRIIRARELFQHLVNAPGDLDALMPQIRSWLGLPEEE